jgi:hypothetical protein
MQPDTVHRLTVVVEDVLAAIVGAVDWARGAVGEVAGAEMHGALAPALQQLRRMARLALVVFKWLVLRELLQQVSERNPACD